MKPLFDWVLWRRGRALAHRLRSVLTDCESLADVGSGTGHNAEILRASLDDVDEYDVVDMHWIGPGPELFDGSAIDRGSGSVDAVLLSFVLQYADDPRSLLSEASRLARRRVVVVQSSFEGRLAYVGLVVREHLWGPVALWAARRAGLVGRFDSPLVTRRHYRRAELRELFADCGLDEVSCSSESWWGLAVRRDLFVLEPRRGIGP